MTLETQKDETIWAQKYRPLRVADTILPANIKTIFQKFVDDKMIPNLLLDGSHGMGKTTAALAMLNEGGFDYIKINGSLNRGVDVLRNEIQNFASSVSFTGSRKYVLIDEADALTPAAQDGLKSFIEDFSKNCGFIFTCNHKRKLIAPIRESRFTTIDFIIDPEERPVLAANFFKRIVKILENEGVEYDKGAVAKLIGRYFPDFRKTLVELQRYSSFGKIDEGILAGTKNESTEALFGFLKDKNFTEIRKWIAVNKDMNYGDFYSELYQMGPEKIQLKSLPGFIVLVAKYQYQHAFVADPEINAMALCSEILLECSFI